MSRQEPSQQPAKTSMTLASNRLDSEEQTARLHQYHKERLARLFRLVNDSADDLYLRNVMARYRGIETS